MSGVYKPITSQALAQPVAMPQQAEIESQMNRDKALLADDIASRTGYDKHTKGSLAGQGLG